MSPLPLPVIEVPREQMNLTGIDPLQEQEFTIRKRDGRVEPFNEGRIYLAVESAFRAQEGYVKEDILPDSIKHHAQAVAEVVVQRALAHAVRGEQMEIERIQDLVENRLMEEGHHAVARHFIIYREARRKARALRGEIDVQGQLQATIFVTMDDGSREAFDSHKIRRELMQACKGLEDRCFWKELADETITSLYDGVRQDEIYQAMVMAAKSRIEREPAYTYVAARILLQKIYREVLPKGFNHITVREWHASHFRDYVTKGVQWGRLAPELLTFDLEKLTSAFDVERDAQFTYMGLQTVYDRYLIHHDDRRIETPQYFWMRVAMGLSVNEANKEERTIEFYEVMSKFHFTSSTPTLFNAGTLHPQLSSCYLSTVMDDLDHIFKVVSDDAKLSKWAGGLGNDWTNVRATGSVIRGTNGRSQGVIPFLKVANDTAVAVNQGGKRKGAMCAYLETWHLDIEDFLELRKNTGDERRRTHDMNTANWIPDLFMKRVARNEMWTLFSPCDVPDLHDLYGAAFEKRYSEYEAMVESGQLKVSKRIEAMTLWRKMLTMLFETGHPWITFKDPSNVRSPQDHVGVVHSSNLCTEILLNTSAEETAVCNLGSINLAAHVTDKGLNEEQIARTVRTAMRMLDNVIDINYYPTPEAKTSNMRHRPVGLGLMAFQDALYKLRISYASSEAIEFADRSMEMISYYALLASADLAKERGAYQSYRGSKWERGFLPIDTIALLEKERGGDLEMDHSTTMNWDLVRDAIRQHGMRNSNTMAIAPTATISNITGVTQSIEPNFKNLYAKSNLSGDFTTINNYLVEDLRRLNLWDEEMMAELKYYDGSVLEIERIPDHIKELYRTAFEVAPDWLIECASRRQKWIDMGQSLNLYMAEPSGRRLNDMYLYGWRKGLKTTYYLRATAASSVEKSTVSSRPRWTQKTVEATPAEAQACSLEAKARGEECEACQ
jgi:ribonucleoside-diphosphate reductase alpha chain